MARVTNYSTLATAVQAYLSRTDVGVSSGNLDYLLAEAEQEMNAELRSRRQLTSLTPTVSSAGVVTLPSDFGGWVRFQVRDGTREWDLDLKAAEDTTRIFDLYGSTGTPEALLMVGSTAQIWPFTDGLYSFAALYFARVPELTSSATTNWVITVFPMAYLYGCLAAARGFVKKSSPEQIALFDLWEKRFRRALKQISRESALDTDARNNVVLSPDTTLFSGGRTYNVMTDR